MHVSAPVTSASKTRLQVKISALHFALRETSRGCVTDNWQATVKLLVASTQQHIQTT